MEIIVNGTPLTTEATTLAELIAAQGVSTAGIAVALGENIVRRDAWATTPLYAGAIVTLIRATQGG